MKDNLIRHIEPQHASRIVLSSLPKEERSIMSEVVAQNPATTNKAPDRPRAA